MKDFLGKELKIGDFVVFDNFERTSSELKKGTVEGFTPTMVKIRIIDPYWQPTTKKNPDKVVVVPRPESIDQEELEYKKYCEERALEVERLKDEEPYSLELEVMDEYYEAEFKTPEHPYSQVYNTQKDKVILDIELKTGQILNMKKVFKPFKLFLKVVDTGIYRLKNEKGEVLYELEGYVPNYIVPEKDGYGDYINLKIADNGLILNWYDDIEKGVEKFKEEALKVK